MDEELQCPVCFYEYTADRPAVVIPCKDGHLICRECITTLYNEHNEAASECWIFGKNCSSERRHLHCPLCRNVCHLRDDTLESLFTWIPGEDNLKERENRQRMIRREILKTARKLKQLAHATISHFEDLKNELNNDENNCRIAKISGASTSIVGGALAVTGGVLAFFTFGASLALTGVGIGLTVTGAGVGGGASIASIVITKKTKTKVTESCQQLKQLHARLTDLTFEMMMGDQFSQILDGIIAGGRLGGTLAGGIFRITVSVIGATADDVAGIALRSASVAVRALQIVGIAAAGVMIVIDLVSLIWNSVEIHQKKPADYSLEIDKIIGQTREMYINKTDALLEAALIKADDSTIVF